MTAPAGAAAARSAPVAEAEPGAPGASWRHERWALAAILALAALLRLWQLDQNGFGREYYAASVRSMLGSWHNFFYLAFDPAGFVSLDKPPLALWMQVAGAKLLGFGPLGVMLPQVVEGVLAVALVHRIVAPQFGVRAGLAAALFLAITPICVAVDRSNNTDSCLILVLLLAAWALVRAIEAGSGRRLVLALALVGLGFNVKMAAALVVLPGFVLAWWVGTRSLALRQRLQPLLLGGVALGGVALAWVSAFDLTPAAERPYAGGTRHNSMLELVIKYNGLERFVSRKRPDTVAPEPSPEAGPEVPAEPSPSTAAEAPGDEARAAAPRARPALYDHTPVGPLRLFTPRLAAQMAWWLPLSLAGLLAGVGLWRAQRPPAAEQAQVLMWGLWALAYGVVFSAAGGIFHTYYLSVLGAPLAALAGIGWARLWPSARPDAWRRALPWALLVVATWQLGLEFEQVRWSLDDWRSTLLCATVGALVLAAGGLWLRGGRAPAGPAGPAAQAVPAPAVPAPAAPAALVALAMAAMLATPLAWALSTVLVRPNVAIPAADIGVLDAATIEANAARPPRRSRARALVEFLVAERRDERFVLAVPNALQAAPFIVRTGLPVMAMGGYAGRDPILTPADLERRVAAGELRFVVLGGYALVPPDTPHELALAEWIRSHGRRVDSALWREPGSAASTGSGATGASSTLREAGGSSRRATPPLRLYDLRPAEPAVATSQPGG